MSLPPVKGGCEVHSDEKDLKDVPATNRHGLRNTPRDSKLRAELKRHYYGAQEETFGADLKYFWKSDVFMFKIGTLTPVIHNPHSLQQLCNKSTMLY